MLKRNWKRVQPRDLRDAMELCLDFARDKQNLSVDGVADMMGLASKWTLYKWVQEASMPYRLIPSFENACGIDFMSRHLVSRGGKIVIEIPRGRQCGAEDIQVLQGVLNDMAGQLIKFYTDKSDVAATLAIIQSALENIAWHKGNVEKYRQPELPFDED